MEDRQFGRISFIGGENGGRYPFNHSLYIEGDVARVIIDPASNLEKLKRLQKKGGVDMVWLSHWHEDHIRYLYLFEDCPKWISRLSLISKYFWIGMVLMEQVTVTTGKKKCSIHLTFSRCRKRVIEDTIKSIHRLKAIPAKKHLVRQDKVLCDKDIFSRL